MNQSIRNTRMARVAVTLGVVAASVATLPSQGAAQSAADVVGQMLKSEGATIEQSLLLSESEYAPHGGCFPIIVKGTGMIGTLTVSGLPQEEDHKVAVHAIRTYLEKA